MNRWPSILLALLSSLLLTACIVETPEPEPANLCTMDWYQAVDAAVPTGDGMGHGPDLGSEEWRSTIEFKLGIRGNPEIPDRNSEDWCSYINDFIR